MAINNPVKSLSKALLIDCGDYPFLCVPQSLSAKGEEER